MCGGCLSVAYTLTGVRGNDDDDSLFATRVHFERFYVIHVQTHNLRSNGSIA